MKEITIKKSSFFANLYKFIYRTDLPMGLCNFFWANVIASVFVIPYTIWCIPVIIVNLIANRKEKKSFIDDWKQEFDGEFWQPIGLSLLAWVLLLLVILYGYGIYFMFTMCQYFEEETAIFWLINIVSLAIFIGWAWNTHVKTWWENRKSDKKVRIARQWFEDKYKISSEDLTDSNVLHKYRVREQEEEEHTSSWFDITLEAIKSFYEKNCPVINWK